MDRPESSTPADTRVPEVAAHRLLARAAELDATRDAMMTLAQLRAAAQEAGISPQAFDQALQELRTTASTETAVAHESRRSLSGSIAVNLGAMAGTWLGLASLATVASRFGVGWVLPAAISVVGLAGGVALAHRLRAGFARVAMLGMAASQAALLAIHLVFGIGSAQGGPTQWAVMAAGLLAAGGAVALGHLRHRPTPPALPDVAPSTTSPMPGADEPIRHQRSLSALRLVTT